MCKTESGETMVLMPNRDQETTISDAGISSEGVTQPGDEEKTRPVVALPLRVPLTTSSGAMPRRCMLDLRLSLKSEWYVKNNLLKLTSVVHKKQSVTC